VFVELVTSMLPETHEEVIGDGPQPRPEEVIGDGGRRGLRPY
jgi:hypothetical protein